MNKILHGDCVQLFRKIPSKSVNLTFADPPFNLNKKYQGYKDAIAKEEYLDWCGEWLTEMVRITADDGAIFIHNIPKWLINYAPILSKIANFKHWISWDAPTSPMGKSLQPSHYGFLYYSKTLENKFHEIRSPHKRCRSCKKLLKDYGGKKAKMQPFGPLVSDVWTDIHRIKHNKYRDGHPCQLPIHLMERIVLMCTDEGDTILDPFSGTGTTAIASKRMNRKYIGFELSQEYVDIAESRLEKENITSNIGGFYISCYNNSIVTARNEDCSNEEFQNYFEWPKDEDETKLIDQFQLKPKEELKNKIKELTK
jgi:site-specific DNA-methyltransferase (adenine-specific)